MKRFSKILAALACCLLCSVFANAQELEFAFVNAHSVNVRKEPSTKAQRLMFTNIGLKSVFQWGGKATKRTVAYHPDLYDAVQIIGRTDGWAKVRFHVYGQLDRVSGKGGYIEGWMSDQFLYTIQPMKLTPEDLREALEEHYSSYMGTEGKLKGIIFMNTYLSNIPKILLCGKIADDHIDIYGDGEGILMTSNPNIKGTKMNLQGSPKTIVNIESIREFTQQQLEQIYESIPKKLCEKRYYFCTPGYEGDDYYGTFKEISIPQ
ncbi:MAG: hypothetical protein HUK08_06885 [Bacteroidaceae bacterium]|nr:hypothetical protein [Bacteroidaceae bacterium]